MADRQEWPKMFYGPGGEHRAFEKDETRPKGWVDHPSKLKDAQPDDAEDKKLVASLREEIERLRSELARLNSDNQGAPGLTPETEGGAAGAKQVVSRSKAAKDAANQTPAEKAEAERFRKEATAMLHEMGVQVPADISDTDLDALLTKHGR